MTACPWGVGGGPGCEPVDRGLALPDVLRESSGVAVSRVRPDVIWSHNDSDQAPTLYAVDDAGALLATVGLAGARIRDWEDMAAGSCPAGSCLYVGNMGDNYEERDDLVLYRLPEPAPEDAEGVEVQAFPFALPDGPRDMEALFVLPGEGVYFITKGRSHPVEVYRYPPPLRPDTVVLERVQFLSSTKRSLPDQITGASASSDGRLVAVRTYRSLRFYRMERGRLHEIQEGGLVNLQPLQESQGEAVGLGPDGLVVLTSEAGPAGGPPGMVVMRCRGI